MTIIVDPPIPSKMTAMYMLSLLQLKEDVRSFVADLNKNQNLQNAHTY